MDAEGCGYPVVVDRLELKRVGAVREGRRFDGREDGGIDGEGAIGLNEGRQVETVGRRRAVEACEQVLQAAGRSNRTGKRRIIGRAVGSVAAGQRRRKRRSGDVQGEGNILGRDIARNVGRN
jgi:hypothetical protein